MQAFAVALSTTRRAGLGSGGSPPCCCHPCRLRCQNFPPTAAPPTVPFPYSLRMYNSLVERCFRDCVSEFRSKDLNAGEEKVRPECRLVCKPHLRRFASLTCAMVAVGSSVSGIERGGGKLRHAPP